MTEIAEKSSDTRKPLIIRERVNIGVVSINGVPYSQDLFLRGGLVRSVNEGIWIRLVEKRNESGTTVLALEQKSLPKWLSWICDRFSK